MSQYNRLLTLIVEAKVPLPPTHVKYPFGNPQMKYIMTSPENVMSGATRTVLRGLRKAKSGTANAGEDLINNVPKNFTAMMRRGRKERAKGNRKKFVARVKKNPMG